MERAAAGLAAAWSKGAQPNELRSLVRPPTLSNGYDLQDRLIELLGQPVVGWKIGLAGRSAYRDAGLERPIFGRVLASRLFRSGDTVPVPADTDVTVELELAVVMAENATPGRAFSPDLIASAHLGFEIVSSRLPERSTIGVPATVADNAVSHAMVLGEPVDFSRFEQIAAQASASADGRPAASALAGDNLPDPLSVLDHLVAHLNRRGETLKRGDVVFTGTLIKPFDIKAPCELVGGAPHPAVLCRLIEGL